MEQPIKDNCIKDNGIKDNGIKDNGDNIIHLLRERGLELPFCLGNDEKTPSQSVYIKTGKYGVYIEYGTIRKSLIHFDKNILDYSLNDIIGLMTNPPNINNNKSLRVINKNADIRMGKYGPYIYYKNSQMRKPRFLNLSAFDGDFLTCSDDELFCWFNYYYAIDM